jgi:hypothetical protein
MKPLELLELFLLLLLACTSRVEVPEPTCDPPGPLVFAPPSGFTPEQQLEIYNAAAVWNEVTLDTHRIVFSAYGTWRILSWPPAVPWLTGQWTPYHVMLIRPGRDDVGPISLHEFGHALGLEHIASPGSLMCGEDAAPTDEERPGYCAVRRDGRPFTSDDIAECRRVGACP